MTNESFLFQKILDKIKDGVIVFDPSLNIIYMNKKAERLIQIGFSVYGDIAAYFNLDDSPESLKRPRRIEHNDRILEFSCTNINVGKLLGVSTQDRVCD